MYESLKILVYFKVLRGKYYKFYIEINSWRRCLSITAYTHFGLENEPYRLIKIKYPNILVVL